MVTGKIKSNDRISIKESPHQTLIEVRSYADPGKQNLLLLWIIAWLAAGIIIFIRLFLDYPRNQKLFFFVFLAFWFYYAWKSVKAYFWRKNGSEVFVFRPGKLIYMRKINQRGLEQSFHLNHIKNLRNILPEISSFSRIFHQSYWSIGGETIGFDYDGSTYVCGLELDEKDQKKLLKLLQQNIKKFCDD